MTPRMVPAVRNNWEAGACWRTPAPTSSTNRPSATGTMTAVILVSAIKQPEIPKAHLCRRGTVLHTCHPRWQRRRNSDQKAQVGGLALLLMDHSTIVMSSSWMFATAETVAQLGRRNCRLDVSDRHATELME